jgi:hypothetical protein
MVSKTPSTAPFAFERSSGRVRANQYGLTCEIETKFD